MAPVKVPPPRRRGRRAALSSPDLPAAGAEELRHPRQLWILRLVVSAALPPSLNDAALRAGYINAHIGELHADSGPEQLLAQLQQLDMPDWNTRTDLARAYNAALAAECARAGLTFLDDFTPLCGPDGLIDPELLVWHGGTDHHLCAGAPAGRRAAGALARQIAAL